MISAEKISYEEEKSALVRTINILEYELSGQKIENEVATYMLVRARMEDLPLFGEPSDLE